ncbi:MAG: hypothetical protein ACK5XO_09430 [Phycisphaerales bacterium]
MYQVVSVYVPHGEKAEEYATVRVMITGVGCRIATAAGTGAQYASSQA